MRRIQPTASFGRDILKDEGTDHDGSNESDSTKQSFSQEQEQNTRNVSNLTNEKDRRGQFGTRYSLIGIAVLCLSTFFYFIFLLPALASRHSVFASIGKNREDDVDNGKRVLPTCWTGKNIPLRKNFRSFNWQSTLVRVSADNGNQKVRNQKQNRDEYVENGSEKTNSSDLPESIRADFRFYYDVSDFHHSTTENQNPFQNQQNDKYDNYHNRYSASHLKSKSPSSVEKNSKDTYYNSTAAEKNERNEKKYVLKNNVPLRQKNALSATEEYCSAVLPDAGICIKESSALGFRCLPSFLIIGTMKSGTGELMTWLNKHPNLQSGRGEDGSNEIHFFGPKHNDVHCPWSHYVKRFPDFGLRKMAINSNLPSGANDTNSNNGRSNKRLLTILDSKDLSSDAGADKEKTGEINKKTHERIRKRFKNDIQSKYKAVKNETKEDNYGENNKSENENKNKVDVLIDGNVSASVGGRNDVKGTMGRDYSWLSRATTVYTFDKTPDYIRDKEKILQIKRMLPSAKIIVLLRDPSTRAMSEFSHNCRHERYIRINRPISIPFSKRNVRGEEIENANQSEKDEGIEGRKENEDETSEDDSVLLHARTVMPLHTLMEIVEAASFTFSISSTSSCPPSLSSFSPYSSSSSSFSVSDSPLSPSCHLPSHSASMWRVNRKQLESSFNILSYPCQPEDFLDFYFWPHFSPTGTGQRSSDRQNMTAKGTKGTKGGQEELKNEGILYLSPMHSLHSTSFYAPSSPGETFQVPPNNLKSPLIANNKSKESNIDEAGNITSRNNHLSNAIKSLIFLNKKLQSGKNDEIQGERTLKMLNERSAGHYEKRYFAHFAYKEVSHGYYGEQLEWVLESFRPSQILMLFQEDMKEDTLSTLRKVENFLHVPCHDFPPISVSGRSLRAAPESIHEKAQCMWKDILEQTFQSRNRNDSPSGKLQSAITSNKEMINKLRDIYTIHNSNLEKILEKHFSIKIPASWHRAISE